ncbi:unnamed protein product [Ranitomeya imitator]|uniref:C2H2-type domain-containing protein n=1 Tax=Ranitomeya imitator TaxID=111125 RepID=A0ABN9MCU8_9NEOB|nr:unnamed protein product [Ranitomeya imitator]
MKSEEYQQILQHNVGPSVRKLGLPQRSWVFQQGNVPKHTSRSTRKWFEKKHWRLLRWPAMSPDLNPIEDLWKDLKMAVWRRHPSNIRDLEQFAKEEWSKIPAEHCKKLIDGYRKRKKPPLQYVRCEMEGCGTVLAHPRYLQHHIKYQHLLKKKYVCPHPSCGRLFRLQKQLMRHAKHHTDQRDYICEYCARAFKSSHNLAVHRMIHTGEKPLQCEFCGFTCRQKASLNWHMKKHDADSFYQFSCGICGKKFEKKDSVVAHKAKSHPEILIAEALAANSGSLITTNNELLVTDAPASTASVVPDGLAPPQTFLSTLGSKVLIPCTTRPAAGLSTTTEVLIEDSDSAGP